MKQKMRELEEDCMALGKERERLYEERHIIEKRAAFEEESLKKRIKSHEEYAKEQEQKLRDYEIEHSQELDTIKRDYEYRLTDLQKEKDDLKERLYEVDKLYLESKKQKENLFDELERF